MATLNPNKLLKEEFVSNLHGSSKLEIAALSALIPSLVILRSFWSSSTEVKGSTSKPWSTLALDHLFVVLPTLLALTVWSDYVYTFTLAALILLGFSLSLLGSRESQLAESVLKKPFLSYYRFVMMLVTCVTILAVDFTVFPRRYGKTETYGTGLMDLGVGSFVAANAMVSKQARTGTSTKDGGALKSMSPLLVLGFARLLATKGVDYQVHVGEYGVHWNFFFTLAAVALLTSVIRIPISFCGFLGLAVLAVHQIILQYGLNTYMLSSDRGSGIMDLNKEGLFSIPGYWALYLVSLQLGHHFFSYPGGILKRVFPSTKPGKWLNAAEIWLLDTAMWLVVILADKYVERVSRRTCNLAYVAFVLAQNLEVMGFFSLAEAFFPSKLLLLQVFDHNLLLTFLVANVLTGLVNVSIDTIFVSALPAILLLTVYTVLLVAIVGGLKMLNF